MTGKNPGRHGIFFFTEQIPGTYHNRYVNGSMRDGVPFWRVMDLEGRRVGVMNVPITYPAEPLNGFMIAGMDAPDAAAVGFAYPPTLVRDLEGTLGRFGDRGPISAAIGGEFLRGHYEAALQILLDRLETRTRWAEHLLREYALDVFAIVHTETDGVAHFFWKFMDPRHPDHAPDLARRYGDAILRVYRKADESVGRLIRAFGEDGLVVVLSDHGAGRISWRADPRLLLRTFLIETGMLATVGSRRGRPMPWRRRTVRRLYEWFNPRFSASLKARLRSRVPGLAARLKRGGLRDATRWTQTRAYVTSATAIYVNLRGREPQGIVEPGREYEEVRREIIRQLSAAVDPLTGERIVLGAYTREAIYEGPHLDGAPDITLELNPDAGVSGFQLGERRVLFPRLRPASPAEAMSGTHRPFGILVLAGPGVAPGASLERPALQDIAPTVLHVTECAVPSDVDGRVLLEAFAGDLRARPVRRTSIGLDERTVQAFSDVEAEQVEERLRALGYI